MGRKSQRVTSRLADADGHGDLVFDDGERVVVLGRDGLFEPADVELSEGFANSHSGRDVVASVEVDEDLDVWSDGVANGAGDLDAFSRRPAGRDVVSVLEGCDVVELEEWVHLDGGVSVGDGLECGAGVGFGGVSLVEPAVGVESEVVSELATEELVDGESESFAFDVPECDVDGGDECGSEASVSGGVEFGEESCPDVVDA